MRKWLIAVALLLVAGGAGWWFGSPWWTLRQMKAAAQAQDYDALMTYVDRDALKDQAKNELRARLKSKDPFKLRASDLFAMGVVAEGLADGLTSREGLSDVFAGRREALGLKVSDLQVAHDGIDQFRLVSPKAQGVELVFRRHGLGWKLAGIRWPQAGI